MIWKWTSFALLAAGVYRLCERAPPDRAYPRDPLAAFQERAAEISFRRHRPQFETTPEAVSATVDKTIAGGNAALDRIGQLRPNEVNFENTIRQLDDLNYQVQCASDRLG